MKPREAKSEKDLLKLKRDNFPSRSDRWSILVNSKNVSLFTPLIDGECKYFSIPKKQFNTIVDFYNRNQKP